VGSLLDYFTDNIIYTNDINSQNNRCYSADNSSLICEVLIQYIKFGLWCAVSATDVIETIFFRIQYMQKDTMQKYGRYILFGNECNGEK
jgi:hypothetical protein